MKHLRDDLDQALNRISLVLHAQSEEDRDLRELMKEIED
jgi:hypothetical protein